MPARLVLTSLLVAGTEAFAPAPIQWQGDFAKRFVLAYKDLVQPSALTIGEQPGKVSVNVVPEFTARPDKTIRWDATGLCIEASGTKPGDAIRVNRCTGGPAQRWIWLPQGHGKKTIQLESSNMCFNVAGHKQGSNQGTIVLRDCEQTSTESWKFEPTTAAASFVMHHGIITVALLVALGAMSLGAWLWRWQRGALVVAMQQKLLQTFKVKMGGRPSNLGEGGVSLTSGGTMFNSCFAYQSDNDACGRHPSQVPSLSKFQELPGKMAHVDDTCFFEESKLIAVQTISAMDNSNFWQRVRQIADVLISDTANESANIESSLKSDVPEQPGWIDHVVTGRGKITEEHTREESFSRIDHMKLLFTSTEFLKQAARIAGELQEEMKDPSFLGEAHRVAQEMRHAMAGTCREVASGDVQRSARHAIPVMSGTRVHRDDGMEHVRADRSHTAIGSDCVHATVATLAPAMLAELHPDGPSVERGRFFPQESRRRDFCTAVAASLIVLNAPRVASAEDSSVSEPTVASASDTPSNLWDALTADRVTREAETNTTNIENMEPRGITPQDTIVFALGLIPYGWATVEFWRRIVNGENFGTGADSIKIDPELYEKLIVDGADEDQLRRAGGRRILGADAMIAARILFAVAGLALAGTAAAVLDISIN